MCLRQKHTRNGANSDVKSGIDDEPNETWEFYKKLEEASVNL